MGSPQERLDGKKSYGPRDLHFLESGAEGKQMGRRTQWVWMKIRRVQCYRSQDKVLQVRMLNQVQRCQEPRRRRDRKVTMGLDIVKSLMTLPGRREYRRWRCGQGTMISSWDKFCQEEDRNMALRSRKCSFQESNSFSCFFDLSWMLGDNVASYGQHCGLRYCLFHMYLCCEKRALVFHIVDSPIHVATKNEGFPGSSVVKNPPALQEPQETQVRSLGWEDPLEEEMATHFSILAWKNPMDRGAYWVIVHGVSKSWTRLTWFSTKNEYFGQGNSWMCVHMCLHVGVWGCACVHVHVCAQGCTCVCEHMHFLWIWGARNLPDNLLGIRDFYLQMDALFFFLITSYHEEPGMGVPFTNGESLETGL